MLSWQPSARNLFRATPQATWYALALLAVWNLPQAFPDNGSDLPAAQRPLIQQIGIGGFWKLGHSCRVRLDLPNDLREQAATIEVATIDGDGVEVVYGRDLEKTETGPVELLVKIGRRRSLISATVKDSSGQQIARQDRLLADTEGLDATQPMLLALGSAMGVDQLSRTSAASDRNNLTVVLVQQAADLPRTWIELQAFDLVVISTASPSLLQSVDQKQWSALDGWVRRGGGCVVSLSAENWPLQNSELLIQWLPGRPSGVEMIRNPSSLESLVATDQPLQPFPCCQLLELTGQVKLSLTDSLGQRVAWWSSQVHGRGLVQTIASDLDHSSFAQWKHRRLLWEKLVAAYWDSSRKTADSKAGGSGESSFIGYRDISGQLRATLEQFSNVKTVGFSQIALLLVVFLSLIGPVDYWISVRWLKRPQLSWLITGLMGLAACLALVAYHRSIRPDQIIVNMARVIDVDAKTGRADGHLWSHIYSARARQIDVEVQFPTLPEDCILDWQGLPGNGLGGLESPMQLVQGMPSYSVISQPGRSLPIISGVGVPAAGTKRFYAAWSKTTPLEHQSSLREMPGLDQLEGEVVNPLDVDLRDTFLLYHRWIYPLKGRLTPGDRAVLSAQIIPRDLERRLNRRQEIDGKLTSVRWDPADRGQLDRVLELMMFHQAASGQNYTSLTHRYQPILDSSNLIESNYAVLLGRLDDAQPNIHIKLHHSDTQLATLVGSNFSWCRIFIPVDVSHQRSGN